MAEPTLQELEQALFNAAYLVQRHGDQFAPVMDRLAREVEMAREKCSSRDRARQILAAMSMNVHANQKFVAPAAPLSTKP